MRTFTYLGHGRNRITYRISERYVVKIPLNQDGVADNWYEAKQCKRDPDTAKCRLLGDCLVMEFVDDIHQIWGHLPLWEKMERINLLPYWVDYVDCRQVGFTRTGKLVAYDFGLM